MPTSRTLTWTPNLRHWSQAEYFLLETQTAWDSRGPYLWAHCRHPACLGESKPTAAHAAEIAKSKFPEVGSPLLGNWNSLKIRAIFMAIARHPQVGSPPLGCRTYVAKASRATLSRITSCLKPNQLETAEAYSPVVTAWQCRWASVTLKRYLYLETQLAREKSKTNSLQFTECSEPQVSRSRSTRIWELKFA